MAHKNGCAGRQRLLLSIGVLAVSALTLGLLRLSRGALDRSVKHATWAHGDREEAELRALVPSLSLDATTNRADASAVRTPAGTTELDSSAGLVLRFVDAQGSALEGVEVALLPPVSEGGAFGRDWRLFEPRWLELSESGIDAMGRRYPAAVVSQSDSIAWRAKSDARGEVAWRGLPAARDWRWGLVTPIAAEVVPVHERLVPNASELGLGVDAFAPRDVSGPLHLAAGAVRRIELRAARVATVRGQLDEGTAPGKLAGALLLRRETFPAADGDLPYTQQSQDARAPVDAAGRFIFEDVRPGPKLVQAFWQRPDGAYEFALRACEPAPGEDLDLGRLEARSGSCTLEVDLVLRSSSGERLAASELLVDADLPLGLLQLATHPGHAPGAMGITEALPVRLGARTRVLGLQPGQLVVGAALHPEAARGLRNPTLPVRSSPHHQTELPAAEVLQLVLEVGDATPTRFVFFSEEVAQVDALQIVLRDRARGAVNRFSAPGGGTHNELPGMLLLARGTYDLIAFGRGATEDQDMYAEATVEVDATDSAPIRVQLRPAARVVGTLLDAGGLPLAGARVLWSLEPFADERMTAWVYEATADDEGRFELAGVVPGHSLTASVPGLDLEVAGPGPRGVTLAARE